MIGGGKTITESLPDLRKLLKDDLLNYINNYIKQAQPFKMLSEVYKDIDAVKK